MTMLVRQPEFNVSELEWMEARTIKPRLRFGQNSRQSYEDISRSPMCLIRGDIDRLQRVDRERQKSRKCLKFKVDGRRLLYTPTPVTRKLKDSIPDFKRQIYPSPFRVSRTFSIEQRLNIIDP